MGAFITVDSYLGAGGLFEGAVAGTFFGAIFALIPSLVGGIVVTDAVRSRDDEPSALTISFTAVAAVINVGSLVALAAYRNAGGLLVLLAGNAGGLPTLWWGRRSIVGEMS